MSLITKLVSLPSYLFHFPYNRIDRKYIEAFVTSFQDNSSVFIDLTSNFGSPLYLFDESRLKQRTKQFRESFKKYADHIDVFYAMKANNYIKISEIMVQENIGLDVSSGLELIQALQCKAKKIFFTGPGKTEKELRIAMDHADIVTILIDSFNELKILDKITQTYKKKIKTGIRLTTNENGLWRKFGIPLSSLKYFMELAYEAPYIQFEGIQFHTSWNLSPDPQIEFIAKLGHYLKTLPKCLLNQIKFLDIGGGFWPEQGEWLRAKETLYGKLRAIVCPDRPDIYSKFFIKSQSLDIFAEKISRALETCLPYMSELRICMEPGRWLCHECMHIIMTVIDIKYDDLVITDAGINAVGWERFEYDYFPVINLTHPDCREQNCHILGSLCTPHDVWGYSYYGEKICLGDLLLIPFQGAYTYSLRQNFIKPLPEVVSINKA